MHTDFQTAQV